MADEDELNVRSMPSIRGYRDVRIYSKRLIAFVSVLQPVKSGERASSDRCLFVVNHRYRMRQISSKNSSGENRVFHAYTAVFDYFGASNCTVSASAFRCVAGSKFLFFFVLISCRMRRCTHRNEHAKFIFERYIFLPFG